MKRRYDLQELVERGEESYWSTIASTHTSPTKTIASYKTGRGRSRGGNGYYTLEGMKARGVKLRMVTTVITEVTESIEDV
jgi:hypothetical protein